MLSYQLRLAWQLRVTFEKPQVWAKAPILFVDNFFSFEVKSRLRTSLYSVCVFFSMSNINAVCRLSEIFVRMSCIGGHSHSYISISKDK